MSVASGAAAYDVRCRDLFVVAVLCLFTSNRICVCLSVGYSRSTANHSRPGRTGAAAGPRTACTAIQSGGIPNVVSTPRHAKITAHGATTATAASAALLSERTQTGHCWPAAFDARSASHTRHGCVEAATATATATATAAATTSRSGICGSSEQCTWPRRRICARYADAVAATGRRPRHRTRTCSRRSRRRQRTYQCLRRTATAAAAGRCGGHCHRRRQWRQTCGAESDHGCESACTERRAAQQWADCLCCARAWSYGRRRGVKSVGCLGRRADYSTYAVVAFCLISLCLFASFACWLFPLCVCS